MFYGMRLLDPYWKHFGYFYRGFFGESGEFLNQESSSLVLVLERDQIPLLRRNAVQKFVFSLVVLALFVGTSFGQNIDYARQFFDAHPELRGQVGEVHHAI